jgi:hypothetical protein
MNYCDAREMRDEKVAPSGLWHYTAQNDNRIFPVGYCAQGCEGHATPEEAREHYRLYLLDNAKYDGTLQGEQRQCEVCGLWTQATAYMPLNMERHILCNEHCNRETLDTVMHRVGQIISS